MPGSRVSETQDFLLCPKLAGSWQLPGGCWQSCAPEEGSPVVVPDICLESSEYVMWPLDPSVVEGGEGSPGHHVACQAQPCPLQQAQ